MADIKLIRILIFLALLVPASTLAAPLHVFTSVLPLQTFVEKVGGKQVRVQSLVRQGFSPATYDPTPQQIVELAQADIFVRVGVPYENAWMERIRSTNPKMKIVDVREGVELRRIELHQHDEEHEGHDHHDEEGEKLDPHIWTAPLLVKRMAATVRDTLIELDPANRQVYNDNYSKFASELEKLDVEIKTLFQQTPHHKFMVFHPSWGYFADAYGLTQVAIENEGKQPGARALVALIKRAKKESVKVVFVQPQFDERQASQIAKAIGGKVIPVDPLALDYVANLRRVAGLFAEELK